MNPLTLEWITKAEGDWGSAQREFQVTQNTNYDLVCYLTQQCAEKYVKARLQEAGATIPKIHDLVKLLNLALPLEPSWRVLLNDLKFLSDFAFLYRYPGATASINDAQDAIESCRKVREAVRQSFGLPI